MKFLKNLKYFDTVRWKRTPAFKHVLLVFEDFAAVVCENCFFYIITRHSDYSLHISINFTINFVVHCTDIIFKILIYCPCLITKGSRGAL